MRLAFFSQNARQRDAIGKQLLGKIRAARLAGHEVRLFLSEGHLLQPELLELAFVGSARELWLSPFDREYLRAADLLEVEYAGDYDLLCLLPKLAKDGIKIHFDYHGVTPSQWWNQSHQTQSSIATQYRGMVWCAQRAVVHSRFAAQELTAATGYPKNRISVLPCFIPDAFENAKTTNSCADPRPTLGLEHARVMLYVGRLAPNKRLHILIHCLAELHKDKRNDKLVVIGCDRDCYAQEKMAYIRLAESLGVAEHVFFLGQVDEATLKAWYQTANVFILPSAHECFGLPVLEAMQHGLPVIASREGALPETVGSAGLTFELDNVDSLVHQLQFMEQPTITDNANIASSKRKLAFVLPRWGNNIVGGAESSLRTMAQAYQRAGWDVEILTTCAMDASLWRNELAEGKRFEDGFWVHRFPVDDVNQEQHAHVYERINRRENITEELESAYLVHSLRSAALMSYLQQTEAAWEAIVVGPYLFGLTYDVAKQYQNKVILVPCFHDEPLAYLRSFQTTYASVAAILFHTRTEQSFAEAVLGINHPRSTVIGTVLPEQAGQGRTQPWSMPFSGDYVVYCGRYCAEKGLDRLIDFARSYAEQHPEFKLVCMGQGGMTLPKESWLVNLGFVTNQVKQQVLAKAKALVHLSSNESLSIVLLEAWAEGTPVVGWRGCEVVVDQIQQAQGGLIVHDAASFSEAIDRLWQNEALRMQLGQAGQEFVQQHYLDPKAFQQKLVEMLESMRQPLSRLMIQRGKERAAAFAWMGWQKKWFLQLQEVHEQQQSPWKTGLQFTSMIEPIQLIAGTKEQTVSLAVEHKGQLPIVGVGPVRTRFYAQLLTMNGQPVGPSKPVAFDRCLYPGQREMLLAKIHVPNKPGRYQLSLVSNRTQMQNARHCALIPVLVTKQNITQAVSPLDPLLQTARQALGQALKLAVLPDDYVDVTEGRFASCKRWIKKKILHNFRKAYVDLLSRQQTHFNKELLQVIQQLIDSFAIVQQEKNQPARLFRELQQCRRANARLQAKVLQLTERLNALEAVRADAQET